MAGWDACTLEGLAFLRWIECHPALGGYLQAIGVVMALGGTAASTYASLAPYREDRKRRGQVVVYRLMPPVSAITFTVQRVRKVFEQTHSGFMLAVENRLDQAVFYFSIDTPIP